MLLVQISETTAFGITFNDCEPLADLEEELIDVFAVQFYASNMQQTDSLLASDQIPVLAINVFPNEASDDVEV